MTYIISCDRISRGRQIGDLEFLGHAVDDFALPVEARGHLLRLSSFAEDVRVHHWGVRGIGAAQGHL